MFENKNHLIYIYMQQGCYPIMIFDGIEGSFDTIIL